MRRRNRAVKWGEDEWEGFDDAPDENQAAGPALAPDNAPSDDNASGDESDGFSDPSNDDTDDALIPIFPAGVIEGTTTKNELKAALGAILLHNV